MRPPSPKFYRGYIDGIPVVVCEKHLHRLGIYPGSTLNTEHVDFVGVGLRCYFCQKEKAAGPSLKLRVG